MARRIAIPFKEMALKVVGPLGDYLAARIQRLDMPVNIPSTDIDELGNPKHAGQTTDVPEVTATFQAMDVSVKLYAALVGVDSAAYPPTGVDISNLGEIDIIGVVRDEDVADYVKSVHLRKCRVTGFTYTYSVDAESTEEYTISGNEKRWFKNDVVVDVYAPAVGSPQVLSQTAIELKNGNFALSAILDGEYLTEIEHDGAPAAGEYSINSAGTQISFADVVASALVVVYHANPLGNNWSDVSDTTIPAAIKGTFVPVALGVNDIERVQSVTIRGTFPNTVIKEMGTRSIVGTITQVPQVTGDVSVLDTDAELIALLTTGQLNPTDTEFNACEFTASGISLKIELLEPASGCAYSGSPVLKTVYIPEIVVTSEGHTSNVGDNVTQTFGFKSKDGSCIIYSGAKP